ncbi:MAG: YolD-like family protein [Firmicutes bacterium]|nr:YolD-like family protein [Bacillota bacterium]
MTKRISNQFLCSSLMLPEHRDALERRRREQREKEETRRPCFDEQQLALWDRLLTAALRQEKELLVRYAGEHGVHSLRGIVYRYVPPRREIFIRVAGATKKVPLDNIIGIIAPE